MAFVSGRRRRCRLGVGPSRPRWLCGPADSTKLAGTIGGSMTVLFFTIALAWLLTLTVAFLGVTRHLGAMQAGGVGVQAPNGGAMFDGDGPWIPSLLPERAANALGARG